SAGTHNGMRSLVAQLGGNVFPRLRVGIGQAPGKMDAAAYVLSRFSKDEEAERPQLLATIADAVEVVLREGLTPAMNRYNPA
ncbi:MAG: aminoacyl-tRNA hydrolase, partial [Chloroflexales bacterium]